MTPADMISRLIAGDITQAECDAMIDEMGDDAVAEAIAVGLAEIAAAQAGHPHYDTARGLIDLRGVHLAESFDHAGMLFAAVDTGTYGYAWGIVVDGWLAVAGDSLTVGELGSLETWAADTSPADWGRWAARAFERRLVAR